MKLNSVRGPQPVPAFAAWSETVGAVELGNRYRAGFPAGIAISVAVRAHGRAPDYGVLRGAGGTVDFPRMR